MFAGGVGICFKNLIFFNMKSNVSIDLPSVENLWIEIKINKKLTVGVVYRYFVQTVEHIDLFSRALTNIFYELNSEKFQFYVFEDFSIDLFKMKSKNRFETYADDLMDSAVKCQITQTTRVCKNSKSLLNYCISILTT